MNYPYVDQHFNSSYKLLRYASVNKDSLQTTLKKFENGGLFLRSGLPSTLIRLENGAFRKHSSNRNNLKKLAVRFLQWKENFSKRSFLKQWRHDHDNHVISLTKL